MQAAADGGGQSMELRLVVRCGMAAGERSRAPDAAQRFFSDALQSRGPYC